MNRRDFKRIMQQKNRNKMLAKTALLASVGVTVGLANINKVEASEWVANQTTNIKQGDKEYVIKWGDYLELISHDSGLTIETLVKLNNIANQDFIYEGNTIQFGDGATAKVVDKDGNVVAETPLTEADKSGIASKVTATERVTSIKGNEETTSNNKYTTVSSNKEKPTNNKEVEKPTTPTKPTQPTKPGAGNNGDGGNVTKPTPPEKNEVVISVTHIQRKNADDISEGLIIEQEELKVKKGEKITIDAKVFDDMTLVGANSQTLTADANQEVVFDYVHKDARPLTIIDKTEDGEILEENTVWDYEILVGNDFTVKSKEFEGYELVGDSEQTIQIDSDENKNTVTFIYKKVEEIPAEEKGKVTIKYVDFAGEEIATSDVKEGKIGDKLTLNAKTINGYVLTSEATMAVTFKEEQQTVAFVYKKSATTPEIKDVTMTVQFLTEDGQELGKDTITAKEGESVTVKAKAFDGYDLADEAEQTIVATQGEVITFIYAKSEVAPIQNVDVAINHVTTDGEFLHAEVKTVKEGEAVTASAETFDGYHLVGNATQSVVAKKGATITFTYEKDAPVAQNVTVNVIHVGDDGVTLGSSQIVAKEGEVVSAKAQSFKGYTLNDNATKSTTAFDGATITFNYAKDVVTPPTNWNPRPTSNNELAVGDWNGTWYESEVGNSGMTFASQEDADGWGAEQPGNGWWTWEVRMEGTNEIRVTVDLY